MPKMGNPLGGPEYRTKSSMLHEMHSADAAIWQELVRQRTRIEELEKRLSSLPVEINPTS